MNFFEDIANHFKPLEVNVSYSLENSLREFKMKVQKEQILQTYKKRARYEKPSDKKRHEKNNKIIALFNQKKMEEELRTGEFQKKIQSRNRKKQEKLAKKNSRP